ncbi:eCIS core domain-containing protein [Streptomyces durhamensis]|uniref:eCIS core domain-containing protein n=1 Tax=Streptomyces durhamensis TaxID=68194 RepID=UPI000D146893
MVPHLRHAGIPFWLYSATATLSPCPLRSASGGRAQVFERVRTAAPSCPGRRTPARADARCPAASADIGSRGSPLDRAAAMSRLVTHELTHVIQQRQGPRP